MKKETRPARTKRRLKAERAIRLLERHIGNVELRFTPNGTLDEVVLVRNDECIFHLEYMSSGYVWMRVEDVHIDLISMDSIRAKARID